MSCICFLGGGEVGGRGRWQEQGVKELYRGHERTGAWQEREGSGTPKVAVSGRNVRYKHQEVGTAKAGVVPGGSADPLTLACIFCVSKCLVLKSLYTNCKFGDF